MKAARFPAYKDLFDFAGRPEGRHRFEPDGRRNQRGRGAGAPSRAAFMQGAKNVCADRWAGHWQDPRRGRAGSTPPA